jgi:hypothetical protein
MFYNFRENFRGEYLYLSVYLSYLTDLSNLSIFLIYLSISLSIYLSIYGSAVLMLDLDPFFVF